MSEKNVFQIALDKANELETIDITESGIDINTYYGALEQIAIKK